MYLRWDYLLIAVYASAILIHRSNPRVRLDWSKKTLAICLLYVSFSVYQASFLQSQTGIAEGLKYASWPVKVLFWGVSIQIIYKKLNCSIWHVYLFIRNATVLIFLIQMLELLIPGFRGLLFELYPVAAQDRLIELTFRARGPFNGYDLASIYYVVVGVFVNQFYRNSKKSVVERMLVYAICLGGSFVAARTGFLLLLTYLVFSAYRNSRGALKTQVVAVVALLIGCLYFIQSARFGDVDDGIIGRYYELVQGVFGGDLGQIASVAGTFNMNEDLLGASNIGLFGQGLTADTTADQLYFKYAFMFGFVGLFVWIAIHFYITVQAWFGDDADKTTVTYRRIVFAVSILIALAHIKGGNYFFSSRLGDIVALLVILGTLKPASSRVKLVKYREQSIDQPA